MLSHLSTKFHQPATQHLHEPRAALFLNRFTRTLTIMYATSGLEDVIGIPADAMRGRSFYYCIAENCLKDAVKCLENAKGNDSIAYLRFWFRDPRIDDPPPNSADDSDEEMTTDISEDGGVQIQGSAALSPESPEYDSHDSNAAQSSNSMDLDKPGPDSGSNSRTSSGDSTRPSDTHEAIFGTSRAAESSTSSLAPSPSRDRNPPGRPQPDQIELEAVISCTSDGLVVCLRQARPMIPHPLQRPSEPRYANGLFAAPWAQEPLLPPIEARPGAGFNSGFAPSLGPLGARHDSVSPARENGPDSNSFMAAIRDQAIFAWALTGINGALADFSKGDPLGASFPQDGFPVWSSDPHAINGKDLDSGRPPTQIFGDPGLDRCKSGSRSASSHNGGRSNGGRT